MSEAPSVQCLQLLEVAQAKLLESKHHVCSDTAHYHIEAALTQLRAAIARETKHVADHAGDEGDESHHSHLSGGDL